MLQDLQVYSKVIQFHIYIYIYIFHIYMYIIYIYIYIYIYKSPDLQLLWCHVTAPGSLNIRSVNCLFLTTPRVKI